MKKLGIVISIIGIICLGFSFYIKHRVDEGKQQIVSAQKKVDQGTSVFSLTPVTKEIGDGLSSPFQEKIDQGKQDVETYETLSNWLLGGGLILVIIGIQAMFKRERK